MSREESLGLLTPAQSIVTPIRAPIDRAIERLLGSFPHPERLSFEERRSIIARYTAVLEGNFIAWMTATYLSVRSAEAQSIILDNLREELRDNHPGMLRKFAAAAHAVPTDADALAIGPALQDVRLFVGGLSSVRLVPMMAFFEGFITRFMPYLSEIARRQGSTEQEYTDVHGVVDVVHSRELFHALEAEMDCLRGPLPTTTQLLEGVEILGALIERMAHDPRPAQEGR